jgi:hypothetical protein
VKTEEDPVARAHLFRPITDREGNLLYNATVTVREVDYAIPVGQPLYAGPTGEDVLDNPLTAVNGVIDFWLETPQRMSILVQHPTVSDILVYLDAPPPPEEIVSSTVPLEIVNTPTVSGQVLLSTSTAGQAQWGNPPSGTGLTPVVVADSQSFSSGGDPAGWGFVQTNGGAHTYDPLSIPPGTNYQYSLRMTQSANNGTVTLTGPTFNLLESGRLSLWIKSSLFSGETFTVVVSDASSVHTTLTTIASTRDWGFYAFDLAAGTYTPIFTYTGQATFAAGDHSLWMTGYVAQYGGNIPPHSHNGTGTNSVALGTGAVASGTSSTAVGVNTTASGANASAYGYGATASGANSLAAGYNSVANGDYSMAVGSGASGTATDTAWVAIGYGANTSGIEAVAVGKNASAQEDYGVAVGSAAQVGPGANSAVAIGQNAQALGASSVAIGQGAVVGTTHNNSVALGSGAATTSANQIMLGNAGAITTVTGSLQNYGLASLGSPGSRIGFYGTAGNVIQTISGSDDGNVTVRTLVNALAAMGLVINNTVQQPLSSATPIGVIDYFYHQDPGDGSLGNGDFDFAPYTYAPLAFSDQSPYPSGPQWYVGADHNAYKGYAGGLGALKNMYNPRHSFYFTLTTTGTGNKICIALRHTGASGSSAAAGYLIFDQAANTLSLATKAAGDPSNTYTVAAGNSISLSTIGATPFDGAGHLHTISVSGTNVMYADSGFGTPVFFQAPALNLTGTYIGVDFAQTTSKFNNITFLPQHTFDGFKTTGALSNAASGEAWWPVQSGAGAGSTVSAAGNLQLTGASGGYALAYVLTGANSSGKNVATRWNGSITPTTGMGVVGRYVDANNYYFINNSQITRVLSGTQTTLATLSQTYVAGDKMSVTFNASGSIVVYRNGTQIGSATDTTSTLLASNRFGLGIRGAGTAGFQYFWCYDNVNGAVTYK